LSAITFEKFGIRVSGTGQVRTVCPECSTSRKKKNDPCLAVNVDQGTWFCHHCGWAGGLNTGDGDYRPMKTKTCKKPDFTFEPKLPEAAYLYLVEERKIRPTVLERNRICFRDGAILFPFYKDGEVLNIKHRTLDKRFWQTKDGEKVLYGFDDIDDTLTIITEGELDKLAVEVAGFKNAVSVPDGAPSPTAKSYASKFSFLDNCKDRLDKVKHFILAVDNDPPGRKLESELVRRLGPVRCSRVEWQEGCKDANDVLIEHGPERLAEILSSPIPYPVEGICEVRELDLKTLYDSGLQSGIEIGWPSIDRLYRLSQESGELHIVTGIPSHGKSEWLDAALVNLAENEGWNFGIFSPENFPIEQHAAKLIEKHMGLPFRDGFQKRMSLEQLEPAQEWLDEHFSFIMPDENHLTVDSILKLARVLVYRKGIRGLVIDPWNEVDHSRPSAFSETEYISESLTKIRRFARIHACHVWVVAHPTKLFKEKSNGQYPIPNPYDISGSAHWRNKADNCLCVWRDLNPKNQSYETHIHVQKIRKKHLGQLGMAKLRYEYSTGRYLEK
jgi:twinkle protein